MSRQFSTKDSLALLAAFGEQLVLNSGSTITVLFETEQVVFEDMASTENYFTCKSIDIQLGNTFTLNGKNYQVVNVVDDHSGIVNAYYHQSGV
ncbi:hypothetical protein SC206_19050 [Rouxiella sp. T17]|uniref:hypothetical protein n=1 Tax=Rouxiella sp. T17 TaxID=3085684 RepID=UPI002FCC7B4D